MSAKFPQRKGNPEVVEILRLLATANRIPEKKSLIQV